MSGEPITFIAERDFKYVGLFFSHNLSEDNAFSLLLEQFTHWLCLVDNLSLDGNMKIWFYAFYIVAKICWPLMVYSWSVTKVQELDSCATQYLVKWSGMLSRGANKSFFWRRRRDFGLYLRKPSTLFKQMQIVKYHLLKYSLDPKMRELYSARLKRERKWSNRWSPAQTLEAAESASRLSDRTKGAQTSTAGLGLMSLFSRPDRPRSRAISFVYNIDNDEQMVHLRSLVKQGKIAQWESVIAADFSWNKLTFGMSQCEFSFMVNAMHNLLPTPDNLRLWGKTQVDLGCSLCSKSNCTLLHVLNHCPFALSQRRFTWRHDSVLRLLNWAVLKCVDAANKQTPRTWPPPIEESFIRAGESRSKSTTKLEDSLLSHANDWRVIVDLPEKNWRAMIPVEILSTLQKPDIVMWSRSTRTMIFLELTCPFEENITSAAKYKLGRYEKLVCRVRARGWQCHLLTLEVGSRGFVGASCSRALTQLGWRSSKSTILGRIGDIARRCSYVIWLHRKNKTWSPISVYGEEESDLG